jgi:pyruvate formate lyase activating enzyme
MNSEQGTVGRGLIFDIRRFSVHDGPGIRTTVFFKGCQLSCWWCHNPESRDGIVECSVKHLSLGGKKFERTETTGRWMTAEEVMQELERDRVFYDESAGGVTFSGGEPMLQEAFLVELMKLCTSRGIHTALDTSGYATREAMDNVAKVTDLMLFDLKLMNDELHRNYTGVSNVPILENLKFLAEAGKTIILRFPVIPGITGTTENVGEMKSFISGELMKTSNHAVTTSQNLQLSLLPYHSMAREKYRRFCKTDHLTDLPSLNSDDLIPMQKEFEAIGLKVSIGG